MVSPPVFFAIFYLRWTIVLKTSGYAILPSEALISLALFLNASKSLTFALISTLEGIFARDEIDLNENLAPISNTERNTSCQLPEMSS